MTVLGDLLHLIGRYGYLAVFFGVTLEGAGVPLPGETVLIAAGALVRRHEPHARGKVRPLQLPRR